VNRRSSIAVASAIYDGLVAVMMVAGRPLMAQIFNVPLPQPPIHAAPPPKLFGRRVFMASKALTQSCAQGRGCPEQVRA